MARYTAHLADDERPFYTACGESWQGWQAPKDLDWHDPEAETLPPHGQPTSADKIRQCQGCFKIATRSSPSSSSGSDG